MNFFRMLFGIKPEIDPQRAVQWWEYDLIGLQPVSASNKTRFEDTTWEVVKKDIKRLGVTIPRDLYFSEDPVVLVLFTVNAVQFVQLYTEKRFEEIFYTTITRTLGERDVWLKETLEQVKAGIAKDRETINKIGVINKSIKQAVESLKKIK